MVSFVTAQQKGCGFVSNLGSLCVEFARSPGACVDSLRVQSNDMHIGLIGNFKLTLDVNVSVFVSLCWPCDLFRVYPALALR